MLTKLSKELKEFGLSDNEIKVYVALIQLGPTTAVKISEQANLNRSTTYVQLTALMEYGLVSTYKNRKKTYFAAESPQNLTRLIEKKITLLQEKKENIDQLIPDLIKVFSQMEDNVEIKTFHGIEGLKTMRTNVLQDGVSELRGVYNFDELYKTFSTEELMEFSNKRAEAGILSRALYNKHGREALVVPPQELTRVSEATHPFGADIYIYGDNISIASTSGNIFGLTITDKRIAMTMKSIFELAWESAKRKGK